MTMENAEEVFQSLDDFAKRKPPKTIPKELEDYLLYVAQTGDPVFQWHLVKHLVKEKLLHVIKDFYESSPGIDIPPCPNVDPFNFDVMKNGLIERIDSFAAAPFTIQRISELLSSPRKNYTRIDKYMRAMEKNILVVSTREPGPPRPHEYENGDHNDSMVNGSDSNSDYNVDVEMEDMSWKENNGQTRTSESMEEESNSRTPAQQVLVQIQDDMNINYESVTPPESDSSSSDSCDNVRPTETEETSINLVTVKHPLDKSDVVENTSADQEMCEIKPVMATPSIVVTEHEKMESTSKKIELENEIKNDNETTQDVFENATISAVTAETELTSDDSNESGKNYEMSESCSSVNESDDKIISHLETTPDNSNESQETETENTTKAGIEKKESPESPTENGDSDSPIENADSDSQEIPEKMEAKLLEEESYSDADICNELKEKDTKTESEEQQLELQQEEALLEDPSSPKEQTSEETPTQDPKVEEPLVEVVKTE